MRSEHLVKSIVARLLDLNESELHLDSPLSEIPDWDSVNALRVLTYLEREIGAPVDFEQFMSAGCLCDLAALVQNAMGLAKQAGGSRS